MKKITWAGLVLMSAACMHAQDKQSFSVARYVALYDLTPCYELTPENVLAELTTIYKAAAYEDYIAEPVSQLEHALQAAQQAMYAFGQNGIDEDNIIAALLHDIGHRYAGKNVQQMDGFGVADHDKIGAAFLAARGFSDKVVALIAGHVDAKRYRVFKDKDYHDKLTYASQQTLIRQGGPMDAKEAEAFEKKPYFEQILLIRSWEEHAKTPGAQTPPFSFFADMMMRHLQKNCSK